MKNKYEKLGIKQVVRLEWFEKTVALVRSGMTIAEIRKELNEYLSTRKQSGGQGTRGEKTYGMAISVLAPWFSPSADLVEFRDELLKYTESQQLPLHWALVSAAYPFWFNVATHVGRLLNLQEQITQRQIFSRLSEQYGDRETVARNARYTVRSFVAWGVLKDSKTRGCYEKGLVMDLPNQNVASLMLEAGLRSTPEGKSALGVLLNSPGFFPFRFPMITGDFLLLNNSRIDVVRYGSGDELLTIK